MKNKDKQTAVHEKNFMRVNGSVHINHIEVKHGNIDFVQKLNAILPKGLYSTVIRNEDRYSSVSSVILSIYGEINTANDANWFRQWASNLTNNLGAPVESAIFDIAISSPMSNDIETHVYVLNIDDGKLHTYRKNK